MRRREKPTVKNYYGWMLIFVVAISAGAQQQQQQQKQKDKNPSEVWTVIRAGSLIDGKSDKPRNDQVVIIRGSHIESISDAATAKIPAGAKVIDLSKATLLPGLIDSHTHIFLQ